MCLAIPGRIIAVERTGARVDFAGVEQTVLLDLLPDARVGEYVLVHAGFAIQRLDAEEAEEIFTQLREIENTIRDENSTARG